MKLAAIALALAVAGCASKNKEQEVMVSEPVPLGTSCQNPNLANGYIHLAEVEVRMNHNIKNKDLTAEAGKNLQKLLTVAKETLDKARDEVLMQRNQQTACTALDISDAILTRVRQDMDKAVEAKKKN